MLHPKVLDSEKCVLVVVDVQEAFRKAIPDFDSLCENIGRIVKMFEVCKLPIIVTEQYPKGLGNTVQEIRAIFPDNTPIFEKRTFSSCGEKVFLDKIKELGASQILLCGIETHVCVNQTAHDLLHQGFDVHILTDAVASRKDADKKIGLKKMFMNGVVPSSVEMAIFEIMRDSRHEQFKTAQNLVK